MAEHPPVTMVSCTNLAGSPVSQLTIQATKSCSAFTPASDGGVRIRREVFWFIISEQIDILKKIADVLPLDVSKTGIIFRSHLRWMTGAVCHQCLGVSGCLPPTTPGGTPPTTPGGTPSTTPGGTPSTQQQEGKSSPYPGFISL